MAFVYAPNTHPIRQPWFQANWRDGSLCFSFQTGILMIDNAIIIMSTIAWQLYGLWFHLPNGAVKTDIKLVANHYIVALPSDVQMLKIYQASRRSWVCVGTQGDSNLRARLQPLASLQACLHATSNISLVRFALMCKQSPAFISMKARSNTMTGRRALQSSSMT